MSLSREDRLRELELLPVWRLKAPRAQPVTAPIASGVSPHTEAIPQAPVTNHSHTNLTRAPDLDAAVMPVSTPSETLVSDASQPSPHNTQSMAITAMPAALSPDISVPTPTTSAATHLPLIQTPWLVYAPGATDADSQALLVNILKAMRLAPEARTLQLQPVTLAQLAVQQMVIFGLAAANQLLGTAHAQLADVRGQVFTLDTIQYIVTHHPHEMLSDPACKKAVWHDLCLLLGQKT